MTNQPPKLPPKPKLLDLSPQDLLKVAASKKVAEKTVVDPEWQAIAEFGYFYGWGGVQAILNNEITGEEMMALLLAARKFHSKDIANGATAHFLAIAAGNSKKPGAEFKKLIKPYEDAAK